MPTRSTYAFAGDLRGPASFTSLPSTTEAFSFDLVDLPLIDLLEVNRADDEMTFPLDTVFDSGVAQAAIDAQLGSDAQRVGDIRAGWIRYAEVPYAPSNPDRHPADHLLATMEFDFHVGTPILCVDIDGHIDYYVDFSLDANGALQAFVDGWSYEFGGGTGILGDGCGRSQTREALDSGVPAGMSALQGALDSWEELLGTLSAPIVDGRARFRDVYLLPADGIDGSGTTDTRDHIALALLPQRRWRFVDVVTRLDGVLKAFDATVKSEHVPHGMALSATVSVDDEQVPVLVHVGTPSPLVTSSDRAATAGVSDSSDTTVGRVEDVELSLRKASAPPRARRSAGANGAAVPRSRSRAGA